MHRILKEDSEFRSLEIPLSKIQREDLEHRILKQGSKDTIYVWKDIIIAGYESYDLYQKHHCFVKPKDQYFSHRDNVIAWICRRQLKRIDLVPNARAWLSYNLYEAEERIEKRRNAKENFQYRQLSPSTHTDEAPVLVTNSERVKTEIAKELGFCTGTLRRNIVFGQSLDQLEKIIPGTRNRILLGELEIAKMKLKALLNIPRAKLIEMLTDPSCTKLTIPKDSFNKQEKKSTSNLKYHVKIKTGIKQMPAYDPDAELNGMTYTLGSWTKAIIRTKENADFNAATITGKERLHKALEGLAAEINELQIKLEVDDNE